jgi:hypothetical protein
VRFSIDTSSSVIRCAFALLSKDDAGAAFPHGQKECAYSARGADGSQAPSATERPLLRHRGEEKEQRRVLGRINADAALHTGLGWARKPKPGLILRTNSQRGVSRGRLPPTSPRPRAGCAVSPGISKGSSAGFHRALRAAQILAPAYLGV